MSAAADWLADGCWADPLSRTERRELARMLARACKRAYSAAWETQCSVPPGESRVISSLVQTSAEMSDLHLDVTERAKTAPAYTGRLPY